MTVFGEKQMPVITKTGDERQTDLLFEERIDKVF